MLLRRLRPPAAAASFVSRWQSTTAPLTALSVSARSSRPIPPQKRRRRPTEVTDADFANTMEGLEVPRDVPVVLSVSGERDSMALAVLSRRYFHKGMLRAVVVAAQSGSIAASSVRKQLEAIGIDSIVIDEPAAQTDLKGPLRLARDEWLGRLDRHSKEFGSGVILTGHNLEGQVETLMLRLGNSSTLEGLCPTTGATQVSDRTRIVRPLVLHEKESLQLTCERAGVSWVEFGVNGKEDANSRKMQSRAVLQRLFSEGKLDRAQLQRMHNHVVFHIATAQLHVSQAIQNYVYYDADLRFALLAMSKSWAFDDHINTRLVTQLLYWVSGVANNRRMERIGDVISRMQRSFFEREMGTLTHGCDLQMPGRRYIQRAFPFAKQNQVYWLIARETYFERRTYKGRVDRLGPLEVGVEYDWDFRYKVTLNKPWSKPLYVIPTRWLRQPEKEMPPTLYKAYLAAYESVRHNVPIVVELLAESDPTYAQPSYAFVFCPLFHGTDDSDQQQQLVPSVTIRSTVPSPMDGLYSQTHLCQPRTLSIV